MATLAVGRDMKLTSNQLGIDATRALLTADRKKNLKAVLGAITARVALLRTDKLVSLKATHTVFATHAFLLACRGDVAVEATNNVNPGKSLIRASKEIRIESKESEVDLIMADLASVTGSTSGEIKVKGRRIKIADAKIVWSDDIELVSALRDLEGMVSHRPWL